MKFISMGCTMEITPNGQLYTYAPTGATLLLDVKARRAQVTIGDHITVFKVGDYFDDVALLIDQMKAASIELTR